MERFQVLPHQLRYGQKQSYQGLSKKKEIQRFNLLRQELKRVAKRLVI
jgi:hypothetical protein